MDSPIVFTPHELIAVILAICAAIVTISGAVTVIAKWITKAREPETIQDTRIATLENDVISLKNQILVHDRYFTADREQIEDIKNQMKQSNKIIIQSLQSLISHAIDGNDIEQLKESKHEIAEFLLSK